MAEKALRVVSSERKTGRPRRQDSYEKVSFTISTHLLSEIDQRARQWGMNRSGAVARIVQSQIDGVSSNNDYQKMKEVLEEINGVLERRRAG